MVERADEEAAGRPPSTPGLNRRSGRIPALPYPPIKHFDCTAEAAHRQSEKASTLEAKAVNPRGYGGQRPPLRRCSFPFGFVREQFCRRLIAQRLVRTLVVVEVEVVFQCRKQIESTGEVAGVDQFAFE